MLYVLANDDELKRMFPGHRYMRKEVHPCRSHSAVKKVLRNLSRRKFVSEIKVTAKRPKKFGKSHNTFDGSPARLAMWFVTTK